MTNQKKRCMTASYSSHINNSPDVLMSSPFSRLLVDEGDHVSLDTAVDGIIWVAHVIQRRCHSSSLLLTIKSAPHVYIYETSQCVKILSFSGDSCDACPTVSPLGACKTTVSAIKLGTARKLKIQCVCVWWRDLESHWEMCEWSALPITSCFCFSALRQSRVTLTNVSAVYQDNSH